MKLGYVLLYVPDVVAAIEFYERAFGLKRRFLYTDEPMPNSYGEMETGSTVLGFVIREMAAQHRATIAESAVGQPSPPMELAFLTDDVPAAYAHALAGGAIAVLPPEQKPWGQIVAYVLDLHGFLIELCTPIPTSA
ncbi:VOC family protein [Tuwongella immobilis]|uniref:VOC domain-containing protein n=1 Tax=Tuwongella immobilis TaxID=692036 RepID=A0A6C2YMJ2_9BACT|nr:VOC family protein [Tuwongella immobilis]VIP02656.1 glyoxalase : Glyoxalase OS=Myxococcus stipitatus (strain DSM 14675 / JCM 12634 / Mx s8) GN=MYSTI_00415 PE=4 SV=1: Glyoxalase_2 [Tuwongella immobilis]VTS02057.1 glyoxalase : Glyoxalase OS=Myxococcus stipitatus (strain DSM 14675 / JCM 12634 / Mx s8) GN=MYSTI_00415 PE=4 SV=1: Glyoxalase_2 [Tuwongella immobilis]